MVCYLKFLELHLLACPQSISYITFQSNVLFCVFLDQVCPIHLRPRLPEFLDVAAKQLV